MHGCVPEVLECVHSDCGSSPFAGFGGAPPPSHLQTPPSGQKPAQGGTTIRVSVGLVQTDVMVFDRKGRFVDNVNQGEFELRVDGKVQPISFFEMVSAGSPHDEEIWAREAGKPVPSLPRPDTRANNPGRTLLFFVDDWHLNADSTMRSRKALENLINTSLGPNDRVGIFSASGQLGSLQLTGSKSALLDLVGKLNFQSSGAEDLDWPPMTEVQAYLLEQNDRDVLTYFVSAILGTPVNLDSVPAADGRTVQDAIRTTRRRAAALAQTSAGVGERTLAAFRSLLRSAESLAGRKLIFFLSDGFVLQPQRSDVVSRIGDVTTAAARAGIVVYSLDARGLVVGLPDAKTKRAGDITGALAHSGANEVSAPMDALNALAADTGGRFLKNTNALGTALITTLAEISRYYLLGWSVDPEDLRPGKYSRILVTVKNRPDLSVRVRQGTLDLSQLISRESTPAGPAGASQAPATKPPNATPEDQVKIYANARSVIDLTREELLRFYPSELRELEFAQNPEELDDLLKKMGEQVERFFRDFPNTLAREQVRLERLNNEGRVLDSITRSYYYSFSPDKTGLYWDEARTDSGGHAIQNDSIQGFAFLTWGYAGECMFFHPLHQPNSRFRYLGRQPSDRNAHVIAFAQKPESSDFMGSYSTPVMVSPALLMYQGLVWVDPGTYQIVRMRTDLLAPRGDVGLGRATQEIWYSEVRFASVAEPFWLPQEVVVTSISMGQTYRNRHRYSDYRVFTVAAQDKIVQPVVKKSP